MDNEMLKTALEYRNLGLSIIPAKVGKIENGKAQKVFPIKWGEFQTRIASEEEITNWYTEHPDWGIAVVCGEISNLVVLDVDDISIDLTKYNLPKTWVVKTGRGFHYYFRYNAKIQKTIQLEKGIELKGNGSTVHAPPTYYSGNIQYQWLENDGEIAELPDAILNAIPEKKYNDGPKLYQIEGKINEGEGRNNAATSYIGHLLKRTPREWWKELCWPALKQWNIDHCNPPLTKQVLGTIFNSIARKESERMQKNESEIPAPQTFKDLYEEELPPEKWIIDQLVPYNGITILSAPPSSYKTWLILQLGITIAKGSQFLEKYETKQTNVLMLNQENYRGLWQQRIRSLTKNEDLNIFFYHQQNFKLEKGLTEKLIALCKDKGIGIVFMDSLVRMHSLDENSATDIKKLFDELQKFTKDDIAVVLTHHHRKTSLNDKITDNPAEQMRGSSDLSAMIDCHLLLTKKENSIVLSQPKQRWDKCIQPIELKLEANIEGMTEFKYLGEYKGDSLIKEELQRLIVNLLENHKGKEFAVNEIKELLPEFSDKVIRANLKYLEDLQEVFSAKRRHGKKVYFRGQIEGEIEEAGMI